MTELDQHREQANRCPECCAKLGRHYAAMARQYAQASEAYARAASDALEVAEVYLEKATGSDDHE